MKHSPTTSRFSVERTDELTIDRSPQLKDYFVLSPCVWKEGGNYHLLLRVVNPSPVAEKKVARIHYGRGLSELRFDIDPEPTVAPGPGVDDRDGCEDPTLAKVGDCYYVYYSGWNQKHLAGQLLLATGRDIHKLKKQGRIFAGVSRFCNAKEATIVRAADKTWRLFFEFAEDGKSKIGLASARDVGGPWEFEKPLFEARPDRWDCWHVSTGPVTVVDADHPVMFYNGANRDAGWRIGWIEFDACFSKVIARSEDPLIAPPLKRREPEDTDVAFAASAVEERDHIGLYYSIADRWVMRAAVKRA